ncbi:SRPBCC domain-containing protein [Draconibacterium sp. IB214405]|uniref:SRPBCC family protein n=1 Tax=Draconibacterium sp. IB214405 TaxID=3097352 RepID=UPI002A0F8793|nr:SRPBCC domain-containing protein [Draconibacterium sp. IB214405]MDX8340723.1 SRPBCC domain-containing protein [Draconibacterium sp. IB214405]
MKSGEEVCVSQLVDASIEKVWLALTDLARMKQWYFENIDHFKAEIGSTSQFAVNSGDRIFTHCWKVIEVDASEKICYAWKYLEYPGDSVVCFQLKARDGKTELTLTHTVREDFPDDIPEFKNESCEAGWNYFLGDRLPAFLKEN